MLGAVPYVAQQKLLRILRDAVRFSPKKTKLIDKVESFAGFNEYGDLTSHLGVKWPNELEDGIDATRTPMDGEVIGLLQDFARQMNARGVPVICRIRPRSRPITTVTSRASTACTSC